MNDTRTYRALHIPSEILHYDRETRVFSCEASEIGATQMYRFSPTSVGLKVRSQWTGVIMQFEMTKEHRDREGELLWTEFHPRCRATRATGVELRVYND